jgi:hypothetical protein
MKKLLFIPLILLLAGCYTQIAIDERPYKKYSYDYDSYDKEYDDSYSDTLYDSEGNVYNFHFYNYPFGYRKFFWGYYPRIYIGIGIGHLWYYDPWYWDYWYYDPWFYPTIVYPIGYWYPYYWYPRYYWNYYRIVNYDRVESNYKLRNTIGLRNSSGSRKLESNSRDLLREQLRQRERIALNRDELRNSSRNIKRERGESLYDNNNRFRELERDRTSIRNRSEDTRIRIERNRERNTPNDRNEIRRERNNERKDPSINRDIDRRRDNSRENDRDRNTQIERRRENERSYSPPSNNSSPSRNYSPPRDNSPRNSSTPPPLRNDSGGRNQSSNERNRR